MDFTIAELLAQQRQVDHNVEVEAGLREPEDFVDAFNGNYHGDEHAASGEPLGGESGGEGENDPLDPEDETRKAEPGAGEVQSANPGATDAGVQGVGEPEGAVAEDEPGTDEPVANNPFAKK